MTLFTARLAGTQEEMGAQHGALVAEEARRLLGFYTTMPERAIAGGAGLLGRLAVKGIATAMQARLGRERPPELLARSRAFGRAAGLPTTPGLLTLATMDSLQNTVALAARMQLPPFSQAAMLRAAVPACSTIIAWGDATEDGELIFARNFDFPGVGVWDAEPAFIVNDETGGQRYGFFATKGADTAVVTVVNEAGLVIAPHTRWHRDVTFGGAMIVDVVHEIARKAETIEDAIRIARAAPASSSWGIAVGSARERTACVLELAGPHVEVVRPVNRGTAASAHTLVCTNHYRSRLTGGEIRGSRAWAIHTERRARRIESLADARLAAGQHLRMEDLARFLGDRVDAGLERAMGSIVAQATNVHASVVKPSVCRALVGIDRAPSCEGRWAEVAWSWTGGPETWTVREREDVAAPHSPAAKALHELARAYEGSHDVPAARAAIESAIATAPDDPSLRLTALWLALEAKASEHAVVHARVGLRHERDAYRRGQLLLWGARAARRVDAAQARTWLGELDAMPGTDGVDELQAAARKRWRGGVHLNLMLADAY